LYSELLINPPHTPHYILHACLGYKQEVLEHILQGSTSICILRDKQHSNRSKAAAILRLGVTCFSDHLLSCVPVPLLITYSFSPRITSRLLLTPFRLSPIHTNHPLPPPPTWFTTTTVISLASSRPTPELPPYPRPVSFFAFALIYAQADIPRVLHRFQFQEWGIESHCGAILCFRLHRGKRLGI